DKPLDQFEGTTFKLISAPLPPEMSAYHWRATDGTLIVVVDPSISKEIFIETLFHEIQEDAWIRRGFDDHEAHVLASAEQIERFSKGQTELTPYNRAQISGMDADRLNAYWMKRTARGIATYCSVPVSRSPKRTKTSCA